MRDAGHIRFNSGWQRLCTGRASGSYSLERMSALREYCDRTPLWRALLVLPLSVIPALAMIVMLDALHLQDPNASWDANPTFWLRAYVGTTVLSLGVMSQLRIHVPAAMLTVASCIVISIWSSGVFTATGMLLARFWVFPVPFLMVVANPPWSLALFGATLCIIGKRAFAERPQIKQQLQRFNNLISFVSTFLVIYSVYNMVFRSLSGTEQLAFLLVLPVIKFVLKRLTIEIVDDIEDSMFVVASTVDMFNAMFQAKCMQSSGSMWTTAGVIAIDAVQNVYSLWCLIQSVGSLQGIVRNDSNAAGVLALCSDAIKDPASLDLAGLRVQSWVRMPVSTETASQLETILMVQADQFSKRHRTECASAEDDNGIVESLPAIRSRAASPASVVPGPQISTSGLPHMQAQADTLAKQSRAAPSTTQTRAPEACTSTVVVTSTLELLWRTERVLLVEYVESAIPLLYGVSLAVLYYLPNAKYYPSTIEMDETRLLSTVASILVYSALEFLSLVIVHVFLEWKFRLSAMHQLAFVLTSERALLQGMVVSWTVVVLSFTLEHYGNDLTFGFEWVHSAKKNFGG